METLNKALKDWALVGGEFSFRVFRDWLAAEYNPHALPYPGGRLRQPKWLDDDLTILQLVRRWHELQGNLPDTAGLPRLDEG